MSSLLSGLLGGFIGFVMGAMVYPFAQDVIETFANIKTHRREQELKTLAAELNKGEVDIITLAEKVYQKLKRSERM